VGENANSANSQTLTNPLGKLLRFNPDGSIPSDNPFFGSTTGVSRAIWAMGLRNPFTFAVHPNSGRIFINDVGQSTWEEINDGEAGANYGWPNTEGPTNDPQYKTPLHSYGHDGACAIAGGTFYAPEVRQFPATYVEGYFFQDLCGGWIDWLNTQNESADFATGYTNPVDMLVGHDGSLYTLLRGSGSSTGAVTRIRWDQHLEGDVNNDGVVNGADAFYLIQHFFASGPAPLHGGDVNNNGSVTTSDLTYLVSYLYGRGTTPQ
jgi:glucose/arabinose dehydrogenase